MLNTNKVAKFTPPGHLASERQAAEISAYLDQHWSLVPLDHTKERMLAIDRCLQNPTRSFSAILVAGSNGKSLTTHYLTKLSQQAGLRVGRFSSPHFLHYAERISINHTAISNKEFVTLANTVITALTAANITAHTLEILTAIACLYFSQQKIDFAVLEVSENRAWDPVTICHTKILAVTRVADLMTASLDIYDRAGQQLRLQNEVTAIAQLATKDCIVIAADQSKLNLNLLENLVLTQGAQWAMPIRKLVPLPYPLEQLQGRCAALAERVAQLYMEKFMTDSSRKTGHNLLIKVKGHRGRPRLDSQQETSLQNRQTLEHFWQSYQATMTGCFQLLRQTPTPILLDTASNLDALNNLLLGIRLCHYKEPIKTVTLIIGCDSSEFPTPVLLRVLHDFFKKHPGQLIICQLPKNVPAKKYSYQVAQTWQPEQLVEAAKALKIKARFAAQLNLALELAQSAHDAKHNLIVVTGSSAIVAEYLRLRGTQKA